MLYQQTGFVFDLCKCWTKALNCDVKQWIPATHVRAFKQHSPGSCVLCWTVLCLPRPWIKGCSHPAVLGGREWMLSCRSTHLALRILLTGEATIRTCQGIIPVLCSVEQIGGCWKMGVLNWDTTGSRMLTPSAVHLTVIALTGTNLNHYDNMVWEQTWQLLKDFYH